jgi:eukaryotic-like serine/threonine-protein kinase
MANLPPNIGKFQVLSELGRGGMGIVYKVKDAKSGQLAALKMIPPEALVRPDSALRFKREFRAMQRVEHPNVIRVFEAGTHESCPFFTMELIEGKDIKHWLDGEDAIVPATKDPPPNGTLTDDQRKRLNQPVRVKKLADAVVQVAYALSEIHSHRIVHRDLKPDNVMVSKAGVVKLMDFGIAKQLSGPSEHSSGGMVVGTFKYLSPEQALGADVDGRADLYCLGIILYELLAGRHPFYSENSVGYAYHHARKQPPDIARFNPEVHKGLKAVCERLIKKDPRDRFPTADDVIAAIREAMDGYVEEMSQKLKPAPKGKELPFELAKDQLFAPSLVGRAAETKSLIGAAEQLLAGRGAVVAVTGKKGIGKTRLVREAAAQAKARNIEFLWGACQQSGGLPYQPYVDILDQLVQNAADTLAADEVKRLLGDEGRVLARYVPAIERLEAEARPRAAPALDPQGEKIRFLSAVTAFLGRCAAAQARVLVIDDIHHADELSLQLTRHLTETLARSEPAADAPAQRFAPLCLIFTLDPADTAAEEARALLSRLSQDRAFQGLAPPPLTPAEVREMLASMIGGGEVAQALADYLHHETEGVPGLVEERVRSWAESGELRRKGRQWVLIKPTRVRVEQKELKEVDGRSGKSAKEPASAPAPVPAAVPAPAPAKEKSRAKVVVEEVDALGPDTLEKSRAAQVPPPSAEISERSERLEVVEVRAATRADIPIPVLGESPSEKRIARLSPIARDVAERMAVAGERAHGTLLERIALRTEDELLDALDELIKRDIISEDKGEAFFRFADGDDRDALLKGIPAERRQRLQLQIARAIEEDAKRHKRKVNPEEQARHYLEGGDSVAAIEQLMQAARVSLAASATQSAAQRVGEAQELVQKELKTQPNDAALIRCDVELVLLRLDVLAAVNIHTDCVSLAKRRLPKLRGQVESRLVCETLLRLAASERVLGDLDAALEHVGEVLATTERGGNHGLRCRAKSLCGQIYEQRGQFDLSERYHTDALELARAIGDELEEERARAAIANRRLIAGDLVSARADFERLLKQAESRGEKLRILGYVNALGIIAHEQARYDEAEVAYRRMLELAKPTGDRRSLAIAHGNIGVVRRDQARFNDALSQCDRAARILKDLNQNEGLAYVRIVEAQTLLDRAFHKATVEKNAEEARADDQAALEKADEAFDLAERASAAMRLAEACICRGQAQVRLGKKDEGIVDILRGLDAAKAVAANRITLFGLSARAEAHALAGEAKDASALWKDAMRRAQSTGFQRFVTRLDDLAAKRNISK